MCLSNENYSPLSVMDQVTYHIMQELQTLPVIAYLGLTLYTCLRSLIKTQSEMDLTRVECLVTLPGVIHQREVGVSVQVTKSHSRKSTYS